MKENPVDIKRIIKEYYKHSMSTNLITLMKWANTLKDAMYQNSHRRNE
jgi:molybdenum cofactor biosynthesis enzyme MoaA